MKYYRFVKGIKWYCQFYLSNFRYDILGKSGERDQFKQQARSCVMEWRDRTFNSPSIDEHYELMIATMDEFRETFLPYINSLQDLK